MILPTIHRNGTSPQALYEQLKKVQDALGVVERALADAAAAEHETRQKELNRIRMEIEAMLEHVSDHLD